MKSSEKKNDWFLFLVIFVWVFAISLLFLNTIGYVPYYVDGTVPTLSDTREREVADMVPQPEPDLVPIVTNGDDGQGTMVTPVVSVPALFPERIIIPSLGTDLPISNPTSTDIAVLDRELLESVVRYPGSGLLDEDGNVFIFGHSTGHRTVRNQLFKAFNGIQTLSKGALIELVAHNSTYVYQVDRVVTTDATDALVDLSVIPGVRRLTLSTCDSFGQKTSRFVVVATFLSKVDNTTR